MGERTRDKSQTRGGVRGHPHTMEKASLIHSLYTGYARDNKQSTYVIFTIFVRGGRKIWKRYSSTEKPLNHKDVVAVARDYVKVEIPGERT